MKYNLDDENTILDYRDDQTVEVHMLIGDQDLGFKGRVTLELTERDLRELLAEMARQ